VLWVVFWAATGPEDAAIRKSLGSWHQGRYLGCILVLDFHLSGNDERVHPITKRRSRSQREIPEEWFDAVTEGANGMVSSQEQIQGAIKGTHHLLKKPQTEKTKYPCHKCNR
jgi:hypothetical protein